MRYCRKRMQYKNNKLTEEQKMKRKFRDSSVWKKFRASMKKIRKVDFVTGKPLRSGFQVHHCDLNPEHYSNLNPDNYITLSRTSHELVHWGFRYNDWEFLLIRLAHVWLKMDKINNKTNKTPEQTKLDLLFEDLFKKLEEHEVQLELQFT